MGAVLAMTKIVRRTDNDEVLELACKVISACQGPLASGGVISQWTYGDHTLKIKQGTLGDGLGAQVWTVAHLLCR